MSAPVDVKSYFQDLLCFLSGRDDLAGFEIQQTEDVAAAVAELIEAAQRIADNIVICDTEDGRAVCAALARVGGAK